MPDGNQTNTNPVNTSAPVAGVDGVGVAGAGTAGVAGGVADAGATFGAPVASVMPEPGSTTDIGAATATDNASAPVMNDAAVVTPVIPEPSGLGSAASDVAGSSVIVDPSAPVDPTLAERQQDAMTRVAEKMGEAHNVLIALSSDPSVDEMAAAIGLSLFLDRIGKKATAIYSGNTPNALEFLEPDKTFEDNADILRDFVIALNKDKADHLRYKLDGEYVKIFITPYKSLISDDDLEFSYGDYNVELVVALNVANGIDLDSALREHGRIMHDATVVNITTGNPGKFGEIEWSDKYASSVCEMLCGLLYNMGDKIEVAPEEATAFLTGIVAATNRFSKPNTTADTMQAASKLMESGANQQLIAQNITDGMDNQFFMMPNNSTKKVVSTAPDTLSINHDDDRLKVESAEETAAKIAGAGGSSIEGGAPPDSSGLTVESEKTGDGANENAEGGTGSSTLLDELQNTAASLAAGSVTVPDAKEQPVQLDETGSGIDDAIANKPERTLTPSEEFLNEPEDGGNKYGKMLEEALAESDAAEAAMTPVVQNPEIAAPSAPDMNAAPVSEAVENSASANAVTGDAVAENPAAGMAPAVEEKPEINGVPEMNYAAEQGDLLPPPPAPPIDLSAPLPSVEAAGGADGAASAVGASAGAVENGATNEASGVGTFKIPGA